MTYWKTKGNYVLEPLNRVDFCYNNAGPNGTKDVSSETSSEKNETPIRKEKLKTNIHKSAEELITKKRHLNARYRKNLSDRQHFWKKMNSNKSFVNTSRFSNQKKYSSQIPKKSQVVLPTKVVHQNQTFSKPIVDATDVKGKNKVASKPKITLQEYEANLKKKEKEFS